jgi:hypothetical protein
MFVRTPVFYAPEDGAGGGEVAPAEVVAPAPAPGEVPAVPAAGTEPAPVEAAPDYGTKVTEWGGEDTIERALKIDKALNTPEGQEALIIQGLQLRGYSTEQIEAFLHPQAAPGTTAVESVEDLLKDPDRQLTAGEIQRILTSRDQTRDQAQTQQAAAVQVAGTIDKTLTELKIPDVNRATILTLADQYLPQPGIVPNDQVVIDLAIRKGAAEFARQVQAEAKLYVETKGGIAATLPTPLPAAGTGGVEAPTEPQSVADAGARVRAKHGFT